SLAETDQVEEDLVEELRQDFAALGYAFLQIQLMTRQLRYTSNLDMLAFGQQVGEAATAAVEGQRDDAQRMLQACFDSLGQERDHYYSLDVSLIDVTLLAPSTLGKSLSKQLAEVQAGRGQPSTLLASGELLQQLEQRHPETHALLRSAVGERQLCLAGGLERERPHPLMTREAIARDLARGRASYQAGGLEPPRIFARLSFGLAPDSVALLRRWGFEGCLLTAWAGGTYPEGTQAKISWEACDGTFLPALASGVLDAADPASFLSLGWAVGEALDHQHVPTLLFAHWPNQSCDFMHLLQIVARRTPALGRWRLADEYFAETDQPYHQERLSPAGFRYNWLFEADSSADLLHAVQRFQRLQARCRALQNLCNLAWQLERYHQLAGVRPAASTSSTANAASEPAGAADGESQPRALEMSAWSSELQRLVELSDGLLDEPQKSAELADAGNALADQLVQSVLGRLAKQLSKSGGQSSGDLEKGGQVGVLLMNPHSSPTRVPLHSRADEHFPGDAKWNFANGRVGDERVTCIDIPSMGFVVAPRHSTPRLPPSKQRPLADAGGLLNNEFLEVQLDNARGHLRSLHIPARRGNRLSLMIARRDQLGTPKKDGAKGAVSQYAYSQMVASDLQMLTCSNVRGMIRVRGWLEMEGDSVGKFEIDYSLWRGSRILEIDLHLYDLAPLSDGNPWRSAYIARLAWPSEAAILRTFAGGSRSPWPSGRALAPTLIEIDETDYRTHYLTGGLAFHRRMEERFLETVLAVRGDTSLRQRLAIGVDLPQPLISAASILDAPYALEVA
ncbi:MAG: hypothetical protein KDA45_13695, partial [Planctomycetales bacterium]|nr:hypothetical protein [Planctomycetales bacterium]